MAFVMAIGPGLGRTLPALAFVCAAIAAPALAANPSAVMPIAAAGSGPIPSLEQACARMACRPGRHQLRLVADDGGSFAAVTEPYPYADEDGTVVLYAGEAFEVAVADKFNPHPEFVRLIPHVTGDGLSGYRPDAPPATGRATIGFELSQAQGAANMTLALRNETGVVIKFDATAFVPTRDGVRATRTSTCPLRPGMMGFESWPHPVVMLVLTNFRRVEDRATLACE